MKFKSSILFFLIISFALFLVACGGSGHAGDTNDSTADEAEASAAEEQDDEQTQEQEAEPKLEIVNSTGGAWENSIGTIWVHSSAVFENTGDVPIEIGETQMNFKDTEDGILGTASMIYSVPSVVEPGEQAYISESTILDTATDASEYKETTYNFSFDETSNSPNLMEVSGVNGTTGADEYSQPYTVTGVVTNTTEELQDDIRIAAALFAEDGSLLGVLKGSVDVGLNPGSEAGFDLSYPDLPQEIADKVETVDVKAYGWTW